MWKAAKSKRPTQGASGGGWLSPIRLDDAGAARALAPQQSLGAVPDTSPLVGRQQELAELARSLSPAAGGSGRGAIVAGPAGVGRSRLLEEGVALAERAGAQVERLNALAVAEGALVDPFDGLGHGEDLVVAVDDAERLPLGEAALLLHRLGRGEVRLLLSIRTDRFAPEALTTMWKDGLLARIDLGPLGLEDVRSVAGHELAGRVDGFTAGALWRLCQGYPQYLAAVIHDGRRCGSLRRDDGLWRWDRDRHRSDRLVQLVAAEHSLLTEPVRRAVEVIACAGPVALAVVEEIVGADVLVEAERSGVVTTRSAVDGVEVDIAHPVHRLVADEMVPLLRRRQIHSQLLDTARGRLTEPDLARSARWTRVPEGGEADDLLACARAALAHYRYREAEGLARRALAAGASEAAMVLAQALEKQGRHRAALEALGRVGPAESRVGERAAVLASNLYWGSGQLRQAQEVLDAACAEEPTAAATQAWILLAESRCVDAARVATGVLARSAVGDLASSWAAVAAGVALALCGQCDRALAILTDAISSLRTRREAPFERSGLEQARCFVQVIGGQLGEAAAVAADGYDAAVGVDSNLQVGGWAGVRGMVAKAAGDLDRAETYLTEAVTILRDDDPYRFARIFVGEMAGAVALRGDHERAQRWWDQVDASGGGANRLFEPWLALDRVWVTASTGAVARAVQEAQTAADLAAANEQFAVELIALHDVARLGRPELVGGRAAELAASSEDAGAQLLASSIAAMASRDGAELARVAAGFGERGSFLAAAEVSALAWRVHQRRGEHHRAAFARESSSMWRARCTGAATPGLQGAAVALLTGREQEIAMLAASGMSSPAIAARLGLSARTVDNHLGRAYAKLHVNSRRALTDLLTAGT